MWRCGNCNTDIEAQYQHCWQCGAKRASQASPAPSQTIPQTPSRVQQTSGPSFRSLDEISPPPDHSWVLRRGIFRRIILWAVIFIFVKVFSSPFLGRYGTYIVLGAGVVMLALILWRFFKRDPAEGVGLKLD